MIKCPRCGKSRYIQEGGYTTLAYYPPIYENGVNINPDKNRKDSNCRCLECGNVFRESEGIVDPVENLEADTNTIFQGQGTQNESIAAGNKIKADTPRSIVIDTNSLYIRGDTFGMTINLNDGFLDKYNKIIINGTTFVKEK